MIRVDPCGQGAGYIPTEGLSRRAEGDEVVGDAVGCCAAGDYHSSGDSVLEVDGNILSCHRIDRSKREGVDGEGGLACPTILNGGGSCGSGESYYREKGGHGGDVLTVGPVCDINFHEGSV